MKLPLSLFNTYYDGSKFPGSGKCNGLRYGANCQYFAYEFLKSFNLKVPDFRSSELWEDRKHTSKVKAFKPFDILFFNKNKEAYGAHLGVYLGNNLVIHLSKEVGYPTIWDLKEFKKREQYKLLIGAKRVKTN